MLPDLGIKTTGLRPLKFVRELEGFEGPILSEFHAESGSGVYVEKWCARDATTTRTLLVRTEQRVIAEYLGGRISLLRLLQGASDNAGFILDKSGGQIVNTFLVSLEELPPKYLPSATAFHDESLRPDWNWAPQSFLLDTRWDANLLAKIEKQYLNAAGFTFFTERGKNRRLPESIFGFEYEGGYPIMHANNRLRTFVPTESRARSVGVSASSPGVLTLDAPSSIANALAASLRSLPGAERHYENLHQWSRFPQGKVLRDPSLMPKPALATEHVKLLCNALKVDWQPLFPRMPEDLPQLAVAILIAGKLIAAHYRRLWRLLERGEGFEFISVKVESDAPVSISMFDDDEEDEP